MEKENLFWKKWMCSYSEPVGNQGQGLNTMIKCRITIDTKAAGSINFGGQNNRKS